MLKNNKSTGSAAFEINKAKPSQVTTLKLKFDSMGVIT